MTTMVKPQAIAAPERLSAVDEQTTAVHLQLVNALRLRYQPIIRLADLHCESVEVLARSEDRNGGLAGPETIVEAMTGAVESMALTGAILHRALAELVQGGVDSIRLACNLPLDAMLHPDLLENIEMIRARHGVPAQRIRFELTERHPVEDIGSVAGVIAMLRQAGYVLALDDITPDMPNLAALLNLPLHAIKLDRSIVIGGTRADNAFIRNIVAHAQTSLQQVIAEGIETKQTQKRMQRLGVTHGQGYLFAHPLTASELRAFLERAG